VSRQTDTITVDRHREQKPRATRVLLAYRHGIKQVPLKNDSELLIGRSLPADVVIDDPSLSRQHARLRCDSTGRVELSDAGSKNGLFLGDRRVERCSPSSGDVVKLGDVSLVLLAGEPSVEPLDHESFLEALQRRIVRARFAKEQVSLVLVEGQHALAEWLSSLQDAGAVALAAYLPCIAEVVLVGAIDPESWFLKLRQTIPHLKRAGMARFGLHGFDADELLSAACAALAAAEDGKLLDPCAGSGTSSRSGAPAFRPVVASDAMQKLYATAKRMARVSLPVLITGETGTGKEVLARVIHEHSARAGRAYVSVNCGALPPSLLESQLFGHERGAFTGADKRQDGLFLTADGGTLFLDEVGELTSQAQVALLRALAEGEILPVGAKKARSIDTRIIAATNRPLEQLVEQGEFRADLFYRLAVVPIEIPPLRERGEDIGALCESFLRHAHREHGTVPLSCAPEALQKLRAYPFPGNVRELRNVIVRAAVLARGDVLQVDDLPVLGTSSTGHSAASGDASFRERIQRYEAELIAEALRECRFNQSEAARRLNMPLRSMVRKIKSYGLAARGRY
jgi:two-component system response regulator AtoC